MRCPKCHYIGFDTGDRCRNCGYLFALAADLPATKDLPLRAPDEPLGPLADLSLGHKVQDTAVRDRQRIRPTPQTDSTSVVGRPPVPRAPLSVRRATPEVPRLRSRAIGVRSKEPTLAFDSATAEEGGRPASTSAAGTVITSEPAGAGSRMKAALVDASLLVAIDVAVIYLTLRLCDLTVSNLGALPLTPLVAFLALLNGGYLVTFTAAGGQTIGKMAAGIKVVGVGHARVPPGSALLRTAASFVAALPVGLGFLAGFFDRERRALHDRLAETRVVKTS